MRRRWLAALACLLGLSWAWPAQAQGVDRGDPQPPWEWTVEVGASAQELPHGVLNLGMRRGPWSLMLLTDTLDLRYQEERPGGRWWIGGRGAAFAAQMLIDPWRDGAPDQGRALFSSYLGADSGVITYLPHGLYLGGQASGRWYNFFATSTTRIDVPRPVPVATPELLLGWWRPWGQAELRAGADVQPGVFAPKVYGQAQLRPDWRLAPWLQLHAGWARRQDFLTYTRVGGLNPYVVPLAGAAWAEFRAQEYAALRAGPALRLDVLELAAVTDLVLLRDDTRETQRQLGLGLLARLRSGAAFAELALGYSPTLERQPGVFPASAWLRAGLDWTTW